MEIKILKGIDGAEKARGLSVVIDVFRAFTTECFLFNRNVSEILALGDKNECLDLKRQHPDWFLVGERKGIKLDGFDMGNSPSQLSFVKGVEGKTVVHSTSAGTQGISRALANSDIVLGGSLVNAMATASFIREKDPKTLSLVAMGLNGTEETREDTLCAEYIASLVKGDGIDITGELCELKKTSGRKFFSSEDPASFPLADFFMCLVPNVFDFVLLAERKDGRPVMRRLDFYPPIKYNN